MVDQLSSGMIGGDFHLYPTRRKTAISRDSQLSLALQQLEEYDMQNLEKKEQMIIRDGDFATFMQHKEEQKSAEIDGDGTAGHDINADREHLASC